MDSSSTNAARSAAATKRSLPIGSQAIGVYQNGWDDAIAYVRSLDAIESLAAGEGSIAGYDQSGGAEPIT